MILVQDTDQKANIVKRICCFKIYYYKIHFHSNHFQTIFWTQPPKAFFTQRLQIRFLRIHFLNTFRALFHHKKMFSFFYYLHLKVFLCLSFCSLSNQFDTSIMLLNSKLLINCTKKVKSGLHYLNSFFFSSPDMYPIAFKLFTL